MFTHLDTQMAQPTHAALAGTQMPVCPARTQQPLAPQLLASTGLFGEASSEGCEQRVGAVGGSVMNALLGPQRLLGVGIGAHGAGHSMPGR